MSHIPVFKVDMSNTLDMNDIWKFYFINNALKQFMNKYVANSSEKYNNISLLSFIKFSKKNYDVIVQKIDDFTEKKEIEFSTYIRFTKKYAKGYRHLLKYCHTDINYIVMNKQNLRKTQSINEFNFFRHLFDYSVMVRETYSMLSDKMPIIDVKKIIMEYLDSYLFVSFVNREIGIRFAKKPTINQILINAY